jgi:hypothetical protein
MSGLAYPVSRNPFPHLGTLRIAGGRFEQGAPIVAGNPKTLPREPIRKLKSHIQSYSERFTPQWSGDGQLSVIRGEHGSGKTHTIYAVWQDLASNSRLFPIYVLQQNADLLGLYQQVVGRIDFPFLKQLSRSFLGSITAEQLSPEIHDEDTRNRVVLQLKENPDRISSDSPPPSSSERQTPPQSSGGTTVAPDPFLKQLFETGKPPASPADKAVPSAATLNELFSSYRVESGATTARQKQALTEMTQGFPNLEKAVRHLQGDQYDVRASDWLHCAPVSAQDLESLGISGPIDTPDEAIAALELLAALFSIGNRSLILFIDQYEKLLLDEDPELSARNVGSLRSLAESFVNRNAMLVLSGNEEAWKGLPSDLRERVGLNQITCNTLRLGEAIDILRIYLTPHDVPFLPDKHDHLSPFTEDTVRTMLELRGGNPRRLLQLAWSAFDKASRTRQVIDSAFISNVARDAADQFVDRDIVANMTERFLARQPFRLTRNFKNDGLTFDFALCNQDGKPALLLDVHNAIFHDDEATGALKVAETIGRLRSSDVRAAYGLVATGYVSPEIVEPLAKLVTRLIVYSRDTFESEMESLMSGVPKVTFAPAPPSPVPPRDDSAAQIAEVRALLLKISEERKNQNIVIEQRSGDLAVNQESRRFEERRDDARREWSEQRRKLEAEIQRMRKTRLDADLEQLERLRSAAERQRKLRDTFLLSGAISALLALILPSSWLFQATRFLRLEYAAGLLSLLTVLAICLVGLAWDRLGLFFGDLPARVSSIRELEQLASRPISVWLSLWLKVQSNPLMRYWRRARRIADSSPPFTHDFAKIASERVGILRQALVRVFLNTHSGSQIQSAQGYPRLLSNPDLLLLLEHPDLATMIGGDNSSIGPPQDLVCALKTGRALGKDRFSLRLATVAGGFLPDPSVPSPPYAYNLPDWRTLSMAFDTGVDRSPVGVLSMLTERSLLEALHELSPFEEGGLGTYDYLNSIKTVDRMFLFVSQLLLYFERDLLQYPPPGL